MHTKSECNNQSPEKAARAPLCMWMRIFCTCQGLLRALNCFHSHWALQLNKLQVKRRTLGVFTAVNCSTRIRGDGSERLDRNSNIWISVSKSCLDLPTLFVQRSRKKPLQQSAGVCDSNAKCCCVAGCESVIIRCVGRTWVAPMNYRQARCEHSG